MKLRLMEMNWTQQIAALQSQGTRFAPGLTDAEVAECEQRYAFRFPPDLRAFLQTALPVGPRFPDWRTRDFERMHNWMNVPRDGLLFDVERNGFWQPAWGPRPDTLEAALELTSALVASAPRLIPIYGHRMMPDEPYEAGNPVFSVHQTDIIVYGSDLAGYLEAEFHLGCAPPEAPIRPIRFWDLDSFQDERWSEGSCVTDPRTLT